jgi:hypothetical protein
MNAEQQPEWFITRIASIEYVHHNSLEVAAWNELQKLDRWILNCNEVDEFKKHVRETVEKLNSSYPRCKPITLSTMDHQDHEDGIEKHDFDFYLSCNMHLRLEAYKGFGVNADEIEVYKL